MDMEQSEGLLERLLEVSNRLWKNTRNKSQYVILKDDMLDEIEKENKVVFDEPTRKINLNWESNSCFYQKVYLGISSRGVRPKLRNLENN